MMDRGASPPDDADPGETHSLTAGSPPAATGDKAAGSMWGDLRLLEEIGHGGFGHVYRAWDETLAREVGLKIIKPRDSAHRADVLREGQMLARVKHRHVVTVHRAQQVGDEVGITMELIRGRHLSDVVAQNGPMGAEEAAVIGVNLCQALAAVHAAGLLHRDIKTRNVMRETGGRIVLMDFGTGRDATPIAQTRLRSDLSGTPLYLAPELFADGTASPASDLYSLGVLLFFLVTQRYPVDGSTVLDLAVKHRAGERQLLSDLRPDLPAAFVTIVNRTLALKPEQRYQSAGALMHDLAHIAHEHPVPIDPVPLPSPPAPSPAGPIVRRWLIRSAGAALAIGFLGLLTSVHYDRALSRPVDMRDGVGAWFEYGVRWLAVPVAEAGAIYLAARLLLAIWYFTRRAMPNLGKATDLAGSRISSRFAPDATSAAQGLLLAEVAVIGLWAWAFWPTLANLPVIVKTDPAASIALLNPDESNGLLHGYRSTMMPVLAAGALAWWWLLTKSPARASVPRGTAAAGIGLLVALLLVLEMPYRLFQQSWGVEGIYNGKTCFEIGKSVDESLLYCPDSPAGDRIKTVDSNQLVEKKGLEKIFSTPEGRRKSSSIP